MESRTERCGDGNDGGERIQTKYDIPDDFQTVRLRVLSWRRNGGMVTRDERSGSQKHKRVCCEDREVDNVPGMRVDHVFSNGLNRENREINGEEEVKHARGCGCLRRQKIDGITQRNCL